MDFIKGINFAPFAPRGVLSSPAALESLDCLLREMRPNTVILTPAGVQKNAQSETIDFTSESTMADEELLALIRRIHARNVRRFFASRMSSPLPVIRAATRRTLPSTAGTACPNAMERIAPAV